MTAGERHQNRAAVLERDDHTCRRCGATTETIELLCYRIGDAPLEDPIHESALVTVCADCLGSLRTEPDTPHRPDADELFSLVRTTTEREGVTVSAVAAFASLTTGLPNDLEDAPTPAENDADDPQLDSIQALVAEYRQARREVLLAIDSVDTELDSLHAVDDEALDRTIAESLLEFTGTATKLQSELRGIVALGESVVAGLERCHGCFESLEDGDDRCRTCGLERRDVGDWQRAPSGEGVAFESLYEAINETLQTASDTTETLTDRTTAVAVTLEDGRSDS